MGKKPSDLNISVKLNSWDEVDQLKDTEIYHPEIFKQAEDKKIDFSKKLFIDIIGKEMLHKPQVVVDSLIRHCEKTTEVSRKFMEDHPRTPLPDDYSLYCGKLDHTTCIAFKVGKPK